MELLILKMRFHKRPVVAITVGLPIVFLFWLFILKSSNVETNNETHQQLPPNYASTKEGKKTKLSIDGAVPQPLSHSNRNNINVLPVMNQREETSSRHESPHPVAHKNENEYTQHKSNTGSIVDPSVRLPLVIGGSRKGENVPKYELDEMIISYGVKGAPVQLSGEDQRLAEEIMRKEAFNVFISDRISLHRNVPDTRDALCHKLSYDTSLPNASVVIIFTNEAFSTLVRTVWSVLDKSKDHPETLHEIILGTVL